MFKQWNALPCATSGVIVTPHRSAVADPVRGVPVRTTPDRTSPPRPLAERSDDPAPRALAAEPAAWLAEQAELRQLADPGLVLTDAQWGDLAAITLHVQAVRQAFEATIARARPAPGGGYRVEIPAYPNAGDALRARFHAELEGKLGAEMSAAIVAGFGDRLEGRFGGFGLSAQTLDFTPAEDRTGSDYAVTRTITYWKQNALPDQPTTRRETHFPGREDPAGHVWGPLLTAAAAQLAAAGGE